MRPVRPDHALAALDAIVRHGQSGPGFKVGAGFLAAVLKSNVPKDSAEFRRLHEVLDSELGAAMATPERVVEEVRRTQAGAGTARTGAAGDGAR